MDFNAHANLIRKELDNFETSVKKLTLGVQGVSNLWKDRHYHTLSASIQDLAKHSISLSSTGQSSISHINEFAEIASEKY